MLVKKKDSCVITAQDLTKTYSGMSVVDKLSMDVYDADIYGFVGRNGAGKSTTMKMICGLVSPSAGKLSVLGKEPAKNAFETGVGALIEAPGLLESLDAMDNMMHKSTALGVKNAKVESQKLLDLVGLGKTGSKQAKAFSLGMKQRLGIALALVGTPKLLLLDEPFNGLDPAVTHEMRETLQNLNRELGITILVSSHVLDQLNRFATRFGVINDGKMVIEFESERMAEMAAGQIRVSCTDMTRAKKVLKEKFPKLKIDETEDGVLGVPGGTVSIREVSDALFEGNLQVLELTQTKRDVEDFFLDLMGKQAKN